MNLALLEQLCQSFKPRPKQSWWGCLLYHLTWAWASTIWVHVVVVRLSVMGNINEIYRTTSPGRISSKSWIFPSSSVHDASMWDERHDNRVPTCDPKSSLRIWIEEYVKTTWGTHKCDVNDGISCWTTVLMCSTVVAFRSSIQSEKVMTTTSIWGSGHYGARKRFTLHLEPIIASSSLVPFNHWYPSTLLEA